MKTVIDYVVNIVFLLVYTTCCQTLSSSITNSSGLKSNGSPPLILPSRKHVIHKKNDRITLSCEAVEPMIWSYPKLENHHNFGSIITIENIHKGVHRSNLIVHNATFADTGFYRCHYNRSQRIGDDDDAETSSSIYVYVYDPNHLLVFWERDVYNVYERNTTTMSWCRPTSPDIFVAIMCERKMIVNSTHVSYPFTYDPRHGFTIDNIYKNIVKANYICNATYSSLHECKMIEIKLSAPPSISIKTEKELYKPGEPISIECHISTDSNALGRLEWKGVKILSGPIESKAVLQHNTTTDQSEEIFCMAQNKDGTRYEKQYLYVTDLNKFCDILHPTYNTSLNEGEQLLFECGATMKKYNKIQWYLNSFPLDTSQQSKDHIIVNYNTSHSHRSLLIIADVKYVNRGSYECRIENESESCGRIDVDVQMKPLISCSNFNQNKIYEYHEMIQLQCSTVSNPLPSKVECIYEVADGIDEIPTTIMELYQQTVTFNLTLSPYESGKIRCNATNEVGTNEMTLDVNVEDVQYLGKYSNDTNAVIHNDSVIIPCRPNYTDVIMKLMNNDVEMASSVSASSPFSFDKNKGFIIQNPYESLNSSEYCCLPERQGKSYPQQQIAYRISGKPRVQILNESYRYEYNTMMTVKCVVFSFSPVDRVDWYFIRNDSTETKLRESSYTRAACSTKNNLCTEIILKITTNESGALRCEASSDSRKYSSIHYIRVTTQTDTTYSSSIIIAPSVFNIFLIIIFVIFICVKVEICVQFF